MSKIDLSWVDDLNVPIEEDMRDSIPCDPMFVEAVINEANKDPWTVAIENWFTSDKKSRARWQREIADMTIGPSSINA